jgi:hypothetical protein
VGAADDPKVYQLNPGVSVWDVAVHDFDGDGQQDILALCSNEEADPLEKNCDLFLATATGGYSQKASSRLLLAPDIGAVFLAEMTGESPKELVAASSEGVQIYAYNDGAFSEIDESRFISLYPSASREPSILPNGAEDVDGDGIDEWIVPMPTGYDVRSPAGVLKRIRCDVNSDIRTGSGMYISNELPAFHAFNLPGETQKALAFLSDAYADFAYGDSWDQTTRFKIPLNLGESWDSTAEMKDINGDGYPDLVVTETRGTVNLRGQTQVYLAKGPMQYVNRPTAKFTNKGSFTAPLLRDINGDGNLDLMFLNVPFGVRFFVNFFVMGNLGINIEVYLFNQGTFGTTPDFKTDLTIEAPDGKEAASYALGDFSGDGRMDVAFGADSKTLAIRTGSAKRLVSSRPWKTINVFSFGSARPYKLNRNEAEDLIIFHPGISHRDRIEVVVF